MRGGLVLGGQAAHRDEPREDDRLDRSLGAPGEHRVGVAALDQLRGFPDGVGSRRTGRHRRIVRALDPERDRELTAGGIDEDARDKARRDALETALPEDITLLDDPGDAADRRAEGDADPEWVEAVQPGVLDRLLPSSKRQQDVTVELALLLCRGDVVELE